MIWWIRPSSTWRKMRRRIWQQIVLLYRWSECQKYFVYFSCFYIDANGLRNVILRYSRYSLVTENMQSSQQWFIHPTQDMQEVSSDIQTLYFYGKVLFEDVLDVQISQSTCSVRDKYSEEGEHISIFSLSHLSNIRNVLIANRLFMSIKSFAIIDMNSLQSIEIDYHSFKKTHSFTLKGKYSKWQFINQCYYFEYKSNTVIYQIFLL